MDEVSLHSLYGGGYRRIRFDAVEAAERMCPGCRKKQNVNGTD